MLCRLSLVIRLLQWYLALRSTRCQHQAGAQYCSLCKVQSQSAACLVMYGYVNKLCSSSYCKLDCTSLRASVYSNCVQCTHHMPVAPGANEPGPCFSQWLGAVCMREAVCSNCGGSPCLPTVEGVHHLTIPQCWRHGDPLHPTLHHPAILAAIHPSS